MSPFDYWEPAFEAAQCLHGITSERSWKVYDQGCLGFGVKWSGTPLFLLPPEHQASFMALGLLRLIGLPSSQPPAKQTT